MCASIAASRMTDHDRLSMPRLYHQFMGIAGKLLEVNWLSAGLLGLAEAGSDRAITRNSRRDQILDGPVPRWRTEILARATADRRPPVRAVRA